MDNVNKGTADRLRNAEDTATGMRVQGAAIAAAAKEFVFEGEPPHKLSFEEFILLLAGRLDGANTQLRNADSVHQVETSDDVGARKKRDVAIEKVRASVIAAGHAITGAFGSDMRAEMGLDATWSMRGDLLLVQARNAVQLIRKDRELTPLAPGVRIHTGELADAIEERCSVLDAALEAVKQEERSAQATFQERELAARVWERTYPGVAEIFTGLCILAGRDELAARVKPTVRKAGRARNAKDASAEKTSTEKAAAEKTAAEKAAETATTQVVATQTATNVATPATKDDVVTH